jgi:hypothetical protein
MATYAKDHNFENLNADEVFQVVVRALPEFGYTVWKTRPIGWLIMANRDLGQAKINATVAIRPGPGAVLNLSLACENLSLDELQNYHRELLSKISSRLD